MKLSKIQKEILVYISKCQPVSFCEVSARWPVSAIDALCRKGFIFINDDNHMEECK